MGLGAYTPNRYTGDGIQTQFAFTFKITAKSEIVVLVWNNATGVRSQLTLTTHYTIPDVDVGNKNGGILTFVTPPASGHKIAILRVPPGTQEASFDQTKFLAKTHEDALDKLTMLAQRLDEARARSLQLPEAEAGSAAATILPLAALRAGRVLAFSADGLTLEPVLAIPTAVVTDYIKQLLDDIDASAARNTLGFTAGGGGKIPASLMDRDVINGQTTENIPADTDQLLFDDVSALALRKIPLHQLLVDGWTEETLPAIADSVLIKDASAGFVRKATLGNLRSALGLNRLIAVTTAQVGNVGAGEDTLATLSLLANTLNANNKCVRGFAQGQLANNANAKTLRVRLGATQIFTYNLSTAAAWNWRLDFLIVRTGSNAQKIYSHLTEVSGASVRGTNQVTTATETDSNALDITVTGEATNNNDVVCEGATAEGLNGA